jgi:hypothetical protein
VYQVFPGGKAAWDDADHTTTFWRRGCELVELYLYLPLVPTQARLGGNLYHYLIKSKTRCNFMNLRLGSAAARMLGLWVRIRSEAQMSVCCECSVLAGRVLRRADHSSRGVLPSVMCLSVIVKPR